MEWITRAGWHCMLVGELWRCSHDTKRHEFDWCHRGAHEIKNICQNVKRISISVSVRHISVFCLTPFASRYRYVRVCLLYSEYEQMICFSWISIMCGLVFRLSLHSAYFFFFVHSHWFFRSYLLAFDVGGTGFDSLLGRNFAYHAIIFPVYSSWDSTNRACKHILC